MKDNLILLKHWTVIGIFVVLMVFLPRIGLAIEGQLELPSQHINALQLLGRKEQHTINEEYHSINAGSKDYIQQKTEYSKFLDAYIKYKRQELGAEGVSVSVISENDMLFLKGYGYADKNTNREVTPLTLFRVGSISKLFTGIAIMQLVEQGKIDLDAPVENYVPGFGYKTHYLDAKPITVRNLMTHQSGLVGDIFSGWLSTKEMNNEYRNIVDLLNEEYVAYPSGYISSYSNSAVSLLGVVIEEVSGFEFDEYIKKNILLPIGMYASDFSLQDYMHPMLARSYDSEGVETPFQYIRDKPAGSLITNSLEMSLFMRMILNGGELFGQRIISESFLKQMFVQQNKDIELDFPNDQGAKWGLSWGLYHPKLSSLGKYVGHGGSIPDYHAQLHVLPEHGLAVIVETNSGSGISADVADMAMIKALEIFKGTTQPTTVSIPPIVPLSQNHIQQMVGIYAANEFGLLSIYSDNYSIYAVLSAMGDEAYELKPHADDWFSLYKDNHPAPGFENLRITVKNGEHERFVGIQYYDNNAIAGSVAQGSEYVIPDELPPEWLNRVGWYSIINSDLVDSSLPAVSIQLLRPGVLSYTVRGETLSFLGDAESDLTYVLDAINEDEAIRIGRGRNINDTIQVVDCGPGECLYHLGFLLKKLSDTSVSTFSERVPGNDDLKKKGNELKKKLFRNIHGYNPDD
jgi:CubicO group peptidase (beta-lactamase class C family)